MNEQINKIRAEIERLIERAKAERVLYPQTILAAKNYLLIKDYNKLLSFIDSLQDEPNAEETELNSLAFLEQLGYTCIPPKESWPPQDNTPTYASTEYKVSKELTTNQNMDSSDAKCGKFEKSEIPTELEEEVNRYWNNHALEYRLGRVADIDFLHLTARHFAEWQKKQDDQICQGCFDRDEVFRKGVLRGAKEQKKQDELEFCYEEAFDNGVKYTKEQMMKEAISADIDDFGVKMYEYCVEKLGLTSEDKVKLYIFKDDGDER